MAKKMYAVSWTPEFVERLDKATESIKLGEGQMNRSLFICCAMEVVMDIFDNNPDFTYNANAIRAYMISAMVEKARKGERLRRKLE